MSVQATAPREQHVLIIGGGIAGLAAALRVRKLDSAYRVTIIDAAARLGGKIAGEIVGGCVVDGGADVCIGDKLRGTHLFGHLGLGQRVIQVNPTRLPTYERRDGQLQRIPTSFDGELLTFRTGMQEIVDAACEALHNVTVITDTSIESLSPDAETWRAESVADTSYIADALIIATPASAAGTLLSGIAPSMAAELSTLEYPPTTTVTMAWRSTDVPHPLDGTGYLVADEASLVSACTWTSSKNPTHAVAGVVLLRGYIRGIAGDGAALLREEVASVLGVTALPLFTRIFEWPAGIPVYTPGHEANVRALRVSLATVPGLFVAGSAFHGIGIPDCINSGERAAEAVIAFLAERHTARPA